MMNFIARHVRTATALLVVAGALLTVPVLDATAQRNQKDTPGEQRQINSLRDLNQAFIQIAKDVTPSVVTVSTERVLKMRNPWGMPFSMDPFGGFFGNPRNQQMPEQELRQEGLGSGVIVSGDGYILTNNHVVDEADSIIVRFSDGRSMGAKVVGTDPKSDVAVIQVDARNLTPIRMGNSDDLQVGEIVLAVGSPLSQGLAHTVTQGIVSAKGRSNLRLAEYEDFIQTDAAINPGNSGGALVNLDGELVGINSAIASRSGGFQGIGFAVPVNMAVNIMNSLIDNGRVVRGWLGVSIQDVDEEMARAMGMEESNGVVIGSVTPDSPAEDAGVKEGDVVVRIDRTDINNSSQLRNLIASTAPGTTVTLGLVRNDREQDVKVKLGELPEEYAEGGERENRRSGGSRSFDPGFDVANITRELARRFEINANAEGVVVTNIDQNSAAYRKGLRVGDLVREVNRRPVSSVEEFDAQMRAMRPGNPVLLLVSRGDQGLFIAFNAG